MLPALLNIVIMQINRRLQRYAQTKTIAIHEYKVKH